jgi:hypothetical protein
MHTVLTLEVFDQIAALRTHAGMNGDARVGAFATLALLGNVPTRGVRDLIAEGWTQESAIRECRSYMAGNPNACRS